MDAMNAAIVKVGRCRLTVSKPELKAGLLSALDAIVYGTQAPVS